MATIVDYASLAQSLQDWLARSDIATYPDYFIQLAENRIYRDILAQNDGKGVRQMEAALSGTITNNTVAIPTDYLALKNARVVNSAGSQFPLNRRSSEYIFGNYPIQSPTAMPEAIARESGNFIFGPYSDSNYSITGIYWNRAAALSSTNTITWMVTAMPDVLFAACMAAAAQFVRDDDATNLWNTFYQQGLQGFITADKTEAWSGSSLSIKSQ